MLKSCKIQQIIGKGGREKNKELGITLIALVITIIVILILAGVSISMMTGNNGILTQTKRVSIGRSKGSSFNCLFCSYN